MNPWWSCRIDQTWLSESPCPGPRRVNRSGVGGVPPADRAGRAARASTGSRGISCREVCHINELHHSEELQGGRSHHFAMKELGWLTGDGWVPKLSSSGSP